MIINYEELFDEEAIIAISRDDVKLINSGKDIFFKIIEINNREDALDEIKKSFEKETLHKNSTTAIVYVESNDNLTLIEQAKMIDNFRELYEDEENLNGLYVIYGYNNNPKIKSDIKITYISSIIDELV